MKKSTVKPHILSWLQSDPAAGVKPFVFTPNLQGKLHSYQSDLITRACLASTTSDFLLVDRSRKRGIRGWISKAWSLIPYRIFLVGAVICMTWPTRNTAAEVDRRSAVQIKNVNPVDLHPKRASRN